MSRIRNQFKSVAFSFRFIWKHTRALYIYFTLSSIAHVVNSILLILFPKYLLDNLVQGYTKRVVVFVILFCACQFALSILKGWIEKKRTICSEIKRVLLKTELINKLSELRFEQIEDPNILRKFEFSQKCIEKGDAETYLQGVFTIISSLAVICSVLFVLDELPIIVWLMIVIVIISNSIGQLVRAKYTYSELAEETPTERELYYFRGRLLNIEYAKEIRTFRLSDFIEKKTISAIERFFNLSQHYNSKHNRTLWWVNAIGGLQTIILYGYNSYIFLRNHITVGSFTSNISALFQFSEAINSVFTQFVGLFEQGFYLTNLQDFLSLKSTYQGRCPLTPQNQLQIQFVDVSFKYPGQNDYALEHINTTIYPQERIAVVGPNGAGKSTFIKLLLGLYRPTSGEILLNGVNIETICEKDYHQLFSTTMQDFQLYSFRIIDNLVFNCQETAEEREIARHCIEQIGLGETINHLPKGIDSFLTQRFDDNGIELSGGEHQKLAIARALYRDAPIMILDEPTSTLSPQSEYDIYSKFGKLTENKTVIYISHRLSICTLCDRILVFEGGKIVEEGNHKQLLLNGKQYSVLYNNQSSLYGLGEDV